MTHEIQPAGGREAGDGARPPGPAAAGSGAEASGSRRSSHLRWLLIVAIPLLFLSSFGFQFHQEVARWYLAAAREKRAEGDAQAAQELVHRAIQWDPRNPGLHAELAGWQEAAGQFEASLGSWTKAIEMNPADRKTYYERAEVYCKLERYGEAVNDADTVLQMVTAQPGEDVSIALNDSAYYRALAGDKLDRALRDAETAVNMIRGQIGSRRGASAGTAESGSRLSGLSRSLATTLDTRGFVQYRLGNLPAAQADLDEALELFVRYCRGLEAMWLTADPGSHRFIRTWLDDERASLGELYYHRSLIRTGLGEHRGAARDLERARDCGFPVEKEHAAGIDGHLVASPPDDVGEKAGRE